MALIWKNSTGPPIPPIYLHTPHPIPTLQWNLPASPPPPAPFPRPNTHIHSTPVPDTVNPLPPLITVLNHSLELIYLARQLYYHSCVTHIVFTTETPTLAQACTLVEL